MILKRKLAAIMVADVAGYSRLIADDEEATLRQLEVLRGFCADSVARHEGRIFNTAGDSILAEFPSAVEAVRCALDFQAISQTNNQSLVPGRRILFRIGITIGDVVEREGDLLGNGVNVAARLQALAGHGGICVSGWVCEAIADKISVEFIDLGQQTVKNIPKPIRAYAAVMPGDSKTTDTPTRGVATLLAHPIFSTYPRIMAGVALIAVFAVGLAIFESSLARRAPPGTSKVPMATDTQSSAPTVKAGSKLTDILNKVETIRNRDLPTVGQVELTKFAAQPTTLRKEGSATTQHQPAGAGSSSQLPAAPPASAVPEKNTSASTTAGAEPTAAGTGSATDAGPTIGDTVVGANAQQIATANIIVPGTGADAPLSPEAERALKAGDVFRECPQCPEMVTLPHGDFIIGSPDNEIGRDGEDEGPRHQVAFGHRVALARYAVTLQDFEAFLRLSGYKPPAGCRVHDGRSWVERPNLSFRNPGFKQSDDHPVVCVSWSDAKAYVAWLAKRTGRPYRLPSEAEREYATRAGTLTPFWLGDEITPRQANYDATSASGKGIIEMTRCGTVPVATFAANPWGLFQVHGNVSEWVEDCWNSSYKGAPSDGSAWLRGDCRLRVLRGGSWGHEAKHLRSAYREHAAIAHRNFSFGFRVARSISARP